MTDAPAQPKNPLHGVTLQAVVEHLVAHFGWAELARQVPIGCFAVDPSVASSLKFLRRTPWAREKVESLYLFTLREAVRQERRGSPRPQGSPWRPPDGAQPD